MSPRFLSAVVCVTLGGCGRLRDDDPRFSKIETLTMNADVHRVRIATLAEMDDTVRTWIERAYRVGCREHLR